jgi:hypothetical protein
MLTILLSFFAACAETEFLSNENKKSFQIILSRRLEEELVI